MYDTLHMLLKDRFIQRRMALLAATVAEESAKGENGENGGNANLSVTENEALQSLKSLADKLVDFIKVRMDSGTIKVFLPTDREAYGGEGALPEKPAEDETDALEGFSVLIDIPSYRMPVQGRGGRRGLQQQADKDLTTTSSTMSKANTLQGSDLGGPVISAAAAAASGTAYLSETGEASVYAPAGGTKPSALRRQGSIQGMPASAGARIPAELVGHLKISANDREQSVDKELSVVFIAEGPTGTVTCSLPQTLRLPSMCVVDRENALEFAANLAAKLVVDMTNPMSQTHNLAIK